MPAPWTSREVRHLLRRTTFGPSEAAVKTLLALSSANAADLVPAGQTRVYQLYQSFLLHGFRLTAYGRSPLIDALTGMSLATDRVLADGVEGAGSHEVHFNGGQLASGVYFCRLRAGEFLQTKGMILVRG
jgi:hypothetical protein